MKGPVPIMRFLRSPSSSSTSRGKMTVTASATFCGNMVFRRLEMNANGVSVGDRHALDFLKRERLYPFLGIGLIAVLDVVGDKLPPVQRRHVVPFHPLA